MSLPTRGHKFDPFSAPGLHYVGDVSCENVNHGQRLPVFEPVAPKNRPSINTLEGWDAFCKEVNTKGFINLFGRAPSCDDELRAWERSCFSKDFQWEGCA